MTNAYSFELNPDNFTQINEIRFFEIQADKPSVERFIKDLELFEKKRSEEDVMNWNEWYILYMTARMKTERLGQAFCNDFISYSWPDLYYCEDQYEAYGKIWDLLDSKGLDSFAPLTKELMELV